ncbi:glycosyltransferase family 2 protein [Gallibacterium anatis]|uniref:glycosyltransferase family 2 protein n=1 Tax=Gallibacterium anatis TaxID=750 RepID=UPI0005319DB7|nr:glycosyltransferase family 2 protein [Gallibacterium anatis]KGQ46859.1 hypothetical protein JP29_00355 [Gallibacterium anatis]
MNKVSSELISIIVPVYNAATYLKRCLNSLLHQTYNNIEILLINDGSTDNSLEICQEYARKDDRIKVFSQKNSGAGAARNLGITRARGEYIGFVDSDDWVCEDMYQYLYEIMNQYETDIAILSHCRCKSIEDSIDIVKNENKKREIVIEYDRTTYIKKYMKIGSQTIEYYPCNKLYKKQLLSPNQYPKGNTTEDVVGTYKAILKANKIVASTKIGYFYYVNAKSVSSVFSLDKGLDMIPAWDEVVALSKSVDIYHEWALLNRARINFNILFQVATSRKYKNILRDNQQVIGTLLADLKKDKVKLIRSDIVLSRKILILLFCFNYRFFSALINMVYRK